LALSGGVSDSLGSISIVAVVAMHDRRSRWPIVVGSVVARRLLELPGEDSREVCKLPEGVVDKSFDLSGLSTCSLTREWAGRSKLTLSVA
jgi:hypothetical protein